MAIRRVEQELRGPQMSGNIMPSALQLRSEAAIQYQRVMRQLKSHWSPFRDTAMLYSLPNGNAAIAPRAPTARCARLQKQGTKQAGPEVVTSGPACVGPTAFLGETS